MQPPPEPPPSLQLEDTLMLPERIRAILSLNEERKKYSKDDPLAVQYYCGWENGFLAFLKLLFNEAQVKYLLGSKP